MIANYGPDFPSFYLHVSIHRVTYLKSPHHFITNFSGVKSAWYVTFDKHSPPIFVHFVLKFQVHNNPLSCHQIDFRVFKEDNVLFCLGDRQH